MFLYQTRMRTRTVALAHKDALRKAITFSSKIKRSNGRWEKTVRLIGKWSETTKLRGLEIFQYPVVFFFLLSIMNSYQYVYFKVQDLFIMP